MNLISPKVLSEKPVEWSMRVFAVMNQKGGVGKTTFSALLIRTLNDQGKRVLAIDADPDANLAAAVGIAASDKIAAIAEMKELIYERTGAKSGELGGFFKLNPKSGELDLFHKGPDGTVYKNPF